jgi:hypothetical protein
MTTKQGERREELIARPEMELLICAARTHLTEQHAARIAELVGGSLDWSLLGQLAGRHKVVPLLCRNLLGTHRNAIPVPIAQSLSQAHFLNVSTNLSLATTVPKLLALFERESIQAIPYKGLDVAMIAYGDLTLRHIGDVDILTTRDDYPRASELLLAEGYRITADWGWERTLADPSGRIRVDLHRAISDRELPIPIDLDRWRARLQRLVVRGGVIPRLSLCDLLLVLCIQIAKDGWVGRCELKKICDIAELIRSHPDLDWQMAVEEAERMGCRRILFLGLLLAHEVLEAHLPQDLVRKIRAEPELDFAARHLCRGIARGDTDPDLASTDKDRFADAIRERWRDRILPRYYHLARSVRPNELDRAAVDLPQRLAFLYYLVRAVRLLRNAFLRATDKKRKSS